MISDYIMRYNPAGHQVSSAALARFCPLQIQGVSGSDGFSRVTCCSSEVQQEVAAQVTHLQLLDQQRPLVHQQGAAAAAVCTLKPKMIPTRQIQGIS